MQTSLDGSIVAETLDVAVHFVDPAGKRDGFREFKGATACGSDGEFLRVVDADGTRLWWPASRIHTAAATPSAPT